MIGIGENMKIVKITKRHYVGNVYNFHCTPDQNYFSEGVLVHNCYKGNSIGQQAKHMSLETFQHIMDVVPKNLLQAAMGLTNTEANPDFWAIIDECNKRSVKANYTTHGLDITPEIARKTKEKCGAVAVSIVQREKSYNAVKMFTDAGMDQVNIHFVLSKQSIKKAERTIDDITNDPRLAKLNAIVFLQYKPKGRNPSLFDSIPDVETYKKIISKCKEKGVRLGFDSCSAPLFFKAVEGQDDQDKLIQLAEPCESFGMFSLYISVNAIAFPCSFAEGEKGWEEGFNIMDCKNHDDFLKQIWHSDKMKKWRDRMLVASQDCDCQFTKVCRFCPIFDITPCRKENSNASNLQICN